MANLFTILPNIQLTSDDITEAELFTQQYLQSQYPDLDLREGTALRDLVIRPSATMVALVNKGIEYHFENNTISGVTDDSSEEIVDNLMSNLFIDRNIGTQAVVSARLFFSRQKSITIPTVAEFSPDDSLKYVPVQTYTFPSSSVSFDSDSSEYYVDVLLQSVGEGTEFNLTEGSLLFFTNFDPYFLRGEISYLKQSSSPRETNSEFIARAYTAISTRNLINNPSIASRLQANFPDVFQIISVGFGHDEMVRDQKEITLPDASTNAPHFGGKTDIYCAVPIVKDEELLLTDSTGKLSVTGSYLTIDVIDASTGTDEIWEVLFTGDPLTVPSDVGLTVYNAGAAIGTLRRYDNSLSKWWITTTGPLTITNGTTVEVITSGGIGTGTESSNVATSIITSATPSITSRTGYEEDGSLIDYDQDLGFSNKQEWVLNFGGGNSDKTISIDVKKFQSIDSIQTYIDDTENRVTCADMLAKAMSVYLIDMTLNTHETTEIDLVEVTPIIESYMRNLKPGEEFVMANLVNNLYSFTSITSVSLPITIDYTLHRRNGTTLDGTILDTLAPEGETFRFELNTLTVGNV